MSIAESDKISDCPEITFASARGVNVVPGQRLIKNIKLRDEGDKLKLTWHWPLETEYVYIFTDASLVNPRLFTLQEYKKRGGFYTQKVVGISTFYVYPFIRENGEDTLCEQPMGENVVSFTNLTMITADICEKIPLPIFQTRYRNHEITLTANHNVPSDIICYAKKENNRPDHDGVMYFFGEPLQAGQPVTRIIRTTKNEYINLFITEGKTSLYSLKTYGQ